MKTRYVFVRGITGTVAAEFEDDKPSRLVAIEEAVKILQREAIRERANISDSFDR